MCGSAGQETPEAASHEGGRRAAPAAVFWHPLARRARQHAGRLAAPEVLFQLSWSVCMVLFSVLVHAWVCSYNINPWFVQYLRNQLALRVLPGIHAWPFLLWTHRLADKALAKEWARAGTSRSLV